MRKTGFLFALIIMIVLPLTGTALVRSENPIIDPYTAESITAPEGYDPDNYLNLLIMGIDFGYEDGVRIVHASGSASKTKRNLSGCHTDAVMLISVDKAGKAIRLLSIPRDMPVYVPDVRGIYKLNAAFNCAENEAQGLNNAVNTASWVLGGIPIDFYAATDIASMIKLGDSLGGIEFKMDYSYYGDEMPGEKNVRRFYRKGKTYTMDGLDIFNYLRARKNIPGYDYDSDRTERQRNLIGVIIQRMQSEPSLLGKLWAAAMGRNVNFFTNISNGDYDELYQLFQGMSGYTLERCAFAGEYNHSLIDQNYFFMDQEKRQELLKNLFAVEVEPLRYIDFDYTQWMAEKPADSFGTTWARRIAIARGIYEWCAAQPDPDEDMKAALEALEQAYDAEVAAFDKAAGELSRSEVKAKGDLMEIAGDNAAALFGYPETYHWQTSVLWYKDPLVNEYNEINWH